MHFVEMRLWNTHSSRGKKSTIVWSLGTLTRLLYVLYKSEHVFIFCNHVAMLLLLPCQHCCPISGLVCNHGRNVYCIVSLACGTNTSRTLLHSVLIAFKCCSTMFSDHHWEAIVNALFRKLNHASLQLLSCFSMWRHNGFHKGNVWCVFLCNVTSFPLIRSSIINLDMPVK